MLLRGFRLHSIYRSAMTCANELSSLRHKTSLRTYFRADWLQLQRRNESMSLLDQVLFLGGCPGPASSLIKSLRRAQAFCWIIAVILKTCQQKILRQNHFFFLHHSALDAPVFGKKTKQERKKSVPCPTSWRAHSLRSFPGLISPAGSSLPWQGYWTAHVIAHG